MREYLCSCSNCLELTFHNFESLITANFGEAVTDLISAKTNHVILRMNLLLTKILRMVITQMQTCQFSRLPRETPALEALIYLPHDF